MKIEEISGENVKLPDSNGIKELKRIFNHPINPEEAMHYILPIFSTPLLKQTIKTLRREEHLCDTRPHIVDYMKAEYPLLVDHFKDLEMLRDDNIEGTLSPLGHKDEED